MGTRDAEEKDEDGRLRLFSREYFVRFALEGTGDGEDKTFPYCDAGRDMRPVSEHGTDIRLTYINTRARAYFESLLKA